MSRLKALLIAERGERCELPGCGSTDLIELHHLNGVEDNRPEALELRCRKHNPTGDRRTSAPDCVGKPAGAP